MSVVYVARRPDDEEVIRELITKYTALLGLDRWTIHTKIDYSCEDRATCEADDEYMEAWLTFNPAAMYTARDALEDTVRHEMLHILVWPITRAAEFCAGDDAAKEELCRVGYERTVTWLERMPVWEGK